MGSIGNSSLESVNDFLNRAVGANNRVRIEANDMESIVGTKAEVQSNDRFNKLFSNMYFGKFEMQGNEVVITAVGDSDIAKRMRRR